MHLIRTGFDGLDISYPLTISDELAKKLETARAESEADSQYLGLVDHNGVRFIVAATGARGGYAFRCDTGLGGPFGEVWFFKRPNNHADQWGVRVSCRALPLALDGLTKVRQRIEATLSALGLKYEPGMESIARVDVACDILAPNFAADRDLIVAHAQTKISEVSTDLMHVVGRSGRVETITVGKNPQRQVVLYDKRAEVIATLKPYWWPIWDAALALQGLPPLAPADRAKSAVWRIEIRAYKRHLKDKWDVTTWGDLRDRLPEILHYALCDVRYTQPTADTNRARWPDHELWAIAHQAFGQELEDLASMADRVVIQNLMVEQRARMLESQTNGYMLALAALLGVPDNEIGQFFVEIAQTLKQNFEGNNKRVRERLMQARDKYRHVMIEASRT